MSAYRLFTRKGNGSPDTPTRLQAGDRIRFREGLVTVSRPNDIGSYAPLIVRETDTKMILGRVDIIEFMFIVTLASGLEYKPVKDAISGEAYEMVSPEEQERAKLH